MAVLPGLSRSGTTIATGLLCGVKKSSMAQFSFLMVLVPILGEAFLELVGGEFAAGVSGISSLSLLLGFIAAFVSGFIACKWMINIVKRAKLVYFAIYCALAGVLSIILSVC
jgi:undecaprenyl-diphosphatase